MGAGPWVVPSRGPLRGPSPWPGWSQPSTVCSGTRSARWCRMAPAPSLLQWGSMRSCTERLCVDVNGGARPPCAVQLKPSVHHRSPLSQTPWKTQCAQSVPLGWMPVHGMSQHRPDVSIGYGVVPVVLVPILGNVAQFTGARTYCCRLAGGAHPGPRRAVSIACDGTARGERYCNARGEILRPLQDPRQRRRSASARSSIKNVSVGSEDDQTPS